MYFKIIMLKLLLIGAWFFVVKRVTKITKLKRNEHLSQTGVASFQKSIKFSIHNYKTNE